MCVSMCVCLLVVLQVNFIRAKLNVCSVYLEVILHWDVCLTLCVCGCVCVFVLVFVIIIVGLGLCFVFD